MSKMGKRELTTQEAARTQRVRALWEEKKRRERVTQQAAAEAMGFESQSAVAQYLNGFIPINLATALRFAAYFGVGLNEIDPELYPEFTNPNTLRVVGDTQTGPTDKLLYEIIDVRPPSPTCYALICKDNAGHDWCNLGNLLVFCKNTPPRASLPALLKRRGHGAEVVIISAVHTFGLTLLDHSELITNEEIEYCDPWAMTLGPDYLR